MRKSLFLAIVAAVLLIPGTAAATRFTGIQAVDSEILLLRFQDGEIRYRDNASGRSAYLGHTFVNGDDTLKLFLPRYSPTAEGWSVTSADDRSWDSSEPLAVWRKSKPMHTDHTLSSELEHWIFLKLPAAMKQGCTYVVTIPDASGSDTSAASFTFDVSSSVSEAIHVNLIGYSPSQTVKSADLYLWLGDGGARDYSSYEGKKVRLYDIASGTSVLQGTVKFWKSREDSVHEAAGKDLTGSGVWNIDFGKAAPGHYRLIVEDVGCSPDFEIKDGIYLEPYRYSVRGYYYMRLGEKVDTSRVWPVPRQPRFVPGEDPKCFTVYKTDLHPWHPDWRKLKGDVWDEPHFKKARSSAFWKHRLKGNPVNTTVRGGHSDAMDWDRHLAHVSNIYDMLLPYILTEGRLCEDNLGIWESGNGLPDIIDEARNEVDFFLSIRDGEAYSQGVTNPDKDWTVMFQAGCTTMAAWANAANCAMLAEALRIAGDDSLRTYYTDEAIKAFRFASSREDGQLDDSQGIGDGVMRGRDFRHMAAAFLYNVTGDTWWEDIMAQESVAKDSEIIRTGRHGWWQLWGTAAYLHCPHEIHYPELYSRMVSGVYTQAGRKNLEPRNRRPSRRSADDPRWQTSENLHLVILAHSLCTERSMLEQLEQAIYDEASWGLGRNPGNIVEMTGLGSRHISDCYAAGRNDGAPGTHPGQTPFNGTEVWSEGNGGDARILLSRCYPDWYSGGWPRQESFFNQRYFWVNGEFTPRETMRGKMALYAYLYGIRP